MQFWALIADSFRESRERKLFWIMLAFSTIVLLALACIGFDENGWSLFFGMWKIESEQFHEGSPLATQVFSEIISDYLIGAYIGWLGTLASLVATAGVFPSFLQAGQIDVVVSKPLSRLTIFFGKYVGSLSFALVQFAYCIVGAIFVLRFHLDVWFLGLLWAIPLLVALFSFVYCVCVLFGLLTRSALAALMLTLLFWISIPGLAFADQVMSGEFTFGREPVQKLSWDELGAGAKVVHVMHETLPKTSDIAIIAGDLAGASSSEEIARRVIESRGETPPAHRRMLENEAERQANLSIAYVLGSSFAFEAVILAIAGFIFYRRDY